MRAVYAALIGVLLGTSALAHADSAVLLGASALAHVDGACAEKDLNSPPSSPLRRLPVYDQDSTGTCWAHTAALVENYELVKSGKSGNDLVNPIFIAWQTKYECPWISSDELSGDKTKDAINCNKEKQNCPNGMVGVCLRDFKNTGHMTDAELVCFLQKLYDNYSSFNLNAPEQRFRSAVDLTVTQLNGKRGFRECYMRAVAEEMRIEGLARVPATEVLNMMFASCKGSRQNVNVPDANERDSGGDAGIQQSLDATLDADHLAGIHICAQVLSNPSSRWLRWEDPHFIDRGSNGNLRSGCGDHEVTVTGRAMIGETCSYLVRNSWGANWHPKDRSCACITQSGAYQQVCSDPAQAREYVGCWYPRTDLVANIQSVDGFQ